MGVAGLEGTHVAVFDSDMPYPRVTPLVVFIKT